MEDYLRLLIDLHKNAKRQGPGGDAETKKIIDLAMLTPSAKLKIAEIGCGTGTSAILLAQQLNAQVTAVDFSPDFIDILKANAEKEGLAKKIDTLVASMDNLPFGDKEFDVIWSEGAVYNIGFEKGVNYWKRFLKPDGLIILSEITWLTNERPSEIQKYWDTEYPEINTASAKISILENAGYSPVTYFFLPEHCWLDNYYQPIQNRLTKFLERNGNSEQAQAIVDGEKQEITLYEKYKEYYSYGVYIAKKIS